MKELSIILPAYLEEENLNLLLPRINSAAHDLCSSNNYEILIIDTVLPMDGTQVIAKQYNTIYLNRTPSNSYGDAIRTGIKAAQGKWTIFMDSDGSHYPEFIKSLYHHKREDGIIIASRYIKHGSTENNRLLILMSYIVNLGYSLILNINCKDISNSFKLYKTTHLKELNLKCHNFDIVEEILYKIIKKNPKIKLIEIPFTFKQRMFGKTKRNLFIFIFTYIITLIKLRFTK